MLGRRIYLDTNLYICNHVFESIKTQRTRIVVLLSAIERDDGTVIACELLFPCPQVVTWRGLEKNTRSADVEFKAPEVTWITQAHIRTEKKHYGKHGKIKYSVSNAGGEERKIRANAQLWCDPPNYPGAPGGWMSVTLYGEHTATPVSEAERAE